MEEPATDPEDLDEELAEYEGDLADVDSEVRGLVSALRDHPDASLRLAVRYSGEEYDAVYVREDVRERYTDAELEERIGTLVLKGHGDPPEEAPLRDFGSLEAVMRFYEGVIVAHFPVREWSGLVFTFDREASPIVDLANQYLDD
ncbi:hypothetical protein [Halosegnis sp.]|uniref:hypothetical protein n=1 Tax=Halosegnis sp. TaxID=2864959 RepID=UPI0035D43F5C